MLALNSHATSKTDLKQMRRPPTRVQSIRKSVVAAASQTGTVKMVVQGLQIELTPSIKQYAEDKVRSQS